MSTITAQLSGFISRARFRGMKSHEWEALWVLQYATRWANFSWSTGLSPAKANPERLLLRLSCPCVCFWGHESIQTVWACLCARMWGLCVHADGRCSLLCFTQKRILIRAQAVTSYHANCDINVILPLFFSLLAFLFSLFLPFHFALCPCGWLECTPVVRLLPH